MQQSVQRTVVPSLGFGKRSDERGDPLGEDKLQWTESPTSAVASLESVEAETYVVVEPQTVEAVSTEGVHRLEEACTVGCVCQ